jgi:hypothetical protein
VVEIVFDDDGDLLPLVIDAAPSEIHRVSATATEQEVERGVSLTDHVRPMPRKLTLDVILSDTPLSAAGVEQEFSRVVDGWALLIDARDRALPAVVTTRLETYEELVLEEAETTRTANDGSWLRVELVFAQIRKVSSELVDDPTPVRPRDRREQDMGSQSTTEDTRPRARSGLLQLGEGLGGLIRG